MNRAVKKITNYFYIGEVDPITNTFILPHESLYFNTNDFKVYKFFKKEPKFIMQLDPDNTIIGHDLTVEHDVLIKNDLVTDHDGIIKNDLRVDHDTSIGNDLEVEHNATIDNNLDVKNNGLVENDLTVNHDAMIGNNLDVKNDATIEHDISVANNATIGNDVDIKHDLLVENDSTILGDEKVNGTVTVNADSDNNTVIQANSILFTNANGESAKLNLIDDNSLLVITLYDSDGNIINTVNIANINTEFETKITVTTDTPEIVLNSVDDANLDISLIVDTNEMSIRRVSDGYKYFIIDDENNQIKLNVETLKIDADSNDNTDITSNIITLNAENYSAKLRKDTDTEEVYLEVLDNTGTVLNTIKLSKTELNTSLDLSINGTTLTVNIDDDLQTILSSNSYELTNQTYSFKVVQNASTEEVVMVLVDNSTGNTLNSLVYNQDQFKVDRRDYTDTTLVATEDLDAGWYSVATFDAGALDGLVKFIILDAKHHQGILLSAIHMNGNSYSDNIVVEAQAYDDAQTITYARIKKGDAGDGAVLQIYVSETTNALSVHYVGENPLYNHWKLKNFIPDDTDPGDVNNYDNMYGSGTNNFSGSQSCSAVSKDLIITAPNGLGFSDISTFGIDATIKYDSEKVYVLFGDNEALKLDNDTSVGYVFGQEILTNVDNYLDENGYQIIGPAGLTMQWAKFTSTTSDDETFSFPTEFNSACYNIQITPIDADTDSNIGTFGNITNVDTTGFTFNRDDNVGDGNFTFYMFAIGV